MQKFVEEHLVKTKTKAPNNDLNSLVERHQILVDAGYEQLAKKTETEMQLHKSSFDLTQKGYPNVLLLHRPHFTHGSLKHKFLTPDKTIKIAIVGFIASISTIITAVLTKNAFTFTPMLWGGIGGIFGSLMFGRYSFTLLQKTLDEPQYTYLKLPKSKLLIECSPSNYLGTIPDVAVRTTVEMCKQNIQPKIWIVASEHQVEEQVRGQVPLKDPLLVGYHENNKDFVTIHAIWGKDIEDMDKLFSNS